MAYNKTPNTEAPEFIEKVVYLNRVSKTVKGGRVMKFSALVVVGDGNGTVGYGLGKAAEVSEAILKGITDAKKNMVKIALADHGTIPHEATGIYGAGKVLMRPAPEGTGVIAGGELIFGGFSSVQSLSHVRLFATPWTTAHQASLSITNS